MLLRSITRGFYLPRLSSLRLRSYRLKVIICRFTPNTGSLKQTTMNTLRHSLYIFSVILALLNIFVNRFYEFLSAIFLRFSKLIFADSNRSISQLSCSMMIYSTPLSLQALKHSSRSRLPVPTSAYFLSPFSIL